MATFHAKFTESEQFSASFSESENLSADFGNVQYIVVGDYYEGEYEITPSEQTQVLQTQQKLMAHDLIVNPIPSNYGLITWNGSVLTVS